MKIATWNINGIKARLETALAWLREANPDVVCLQEIKCADDAFPVEPFQDAGYQVTTHGQKGFNGVAILSKRPVEDVMSGLPGDDQDAHARYLEATVAARDGAVRVVSLYLPNGNPIGSEKFAYKLAWMARLEARLRTLLLSEMPLVVAGDYNVIPMPEDAKSPQAWTNDALYQPESRTAFRRCVNLGFYDAIRMAAPGPDQFTFWDYQAGAWQKNNGIRIDHVLLSPQAADLMVSAGIDRETRGWEKPSDHVPVWVELAH
jgi:exodeoxyribonuclease-3